VMKHSYQVPIYTQILFVSSPGQHDQLLEWFIQGIQRLEDQLGSGRYSTSDISAITQGLLGIAKAITRFFKHLTSLRVPEFGRKMKYQQYLRTIWLRETITTFTGYCHRYSLVVLRLARMQETRTSEPPLEVSEADLASNVSTQSSISSLDLLAISEVSSISDISK
jgi:hypothetical protein